MYTLKIRNQWNTNFGEKHENPVIGVLWQGQQRLSEWMDFWEKPKDKALGPGTEFERSRIKYIPNHIFEAVYLAYVY